MGMDVKADYPKDLRCVGSETGTSQERTNEAAIEGLFNRSLGALSTFTVAPLRLRRREFFVS